MYLIDNQHSRLHLSRNVTSQSRQRGKGRRGVSGECMPPVAVPALPATHLILLGRNASKHRHMQMMRFGHHVRHTS
jgi:hypothetical protein